MVTSLIQSETTIKNLACYMSNGGATGKMCETNLRS